MPVEEWIYKPGLPASAPTPASDAFAKVERQAQEWIKGETPASKLQTASWTTHEWLHFLRHLPEHLSKEKMAELDQHSDSSSAYELRTSGF